MPPSVLLSSAAPWHCPAGRQGLGRDGSSLGTHGMSWDEGYQWERSWVMEDTGDHGRIMGEVRDDGRSKGPWEK